MEPIYLDHAATTPPRPEVREAMDPYLEGTFGNPSSAHRWGRAAAAALEGAREAVARALGAEKAEIHFVRGGTEGNNLAVLGRVEAELAAGRAPVVGISAVEHSSVRDLVPVVERMGGRVTPIPVSPAGLLEAEVLDELLRSPGVGLLSVMWVNNEVGTVLPVPELAPRARDAGVALHVDAVQAVGKVPVDLGEAPVALATLTGHKIYGPKGAGALFVREGTDLTPRLFGGGQERGLRPGTEDVAGAVGLARAVELAVEEQEAEARRLGALRDRLEDQLTERIPGLRVHGREGPRAPHVLHVGIPQVPRDGLLSALDLEGLAVSGGSACASGTPTTSPVLTALYGEEVRELAQVRYSLGRTTDEADVDAAAEVTETVVERLRSLALT